MSNIDELKSQLTILENDLTNLETHIKSLQDKGEENLSNEEKFNLNNWLNEQINLKFMVEQLEKKIAQGQDSFSSNPPPDREPDTAPCADANCAPGNPDGLPTPIWNL